MRLPCGQRRKLQRIEQDLDLSNRRLMELYSMFNWLHRSEAMPRLERIRVRIDWRGRRARRAAAAGVLH